MRCFAERPATDGLNEKGLSAAAIWLDETEYPIIDSSYGNMLVTVHYSIDWLLGNFANVSEAKAAMPITKFIACQFNEFEKAPTLHFIMRDAQGGNLLIEWLNGELVLSEGRIDVVANDPSYANKKTINCLERYNQTFNEAELPLQYQPTTDAHIIAFPGNSTPESRFIRASMLNAAINAPSSYLDALANIVGIMNRLQIQPCEIRSKDGSICDSTTYWTVYRDHLNLLYYYKHRQNQILRCIDLKKINFDKITTEITLPLETGSEYFMDMTDVYSFCQRYY